MAPEKLEENESSFETWGILELMGHRRLAGRIIEEERFGTAMCRIDVPEGDGWLTQYYSGGSIYCLTPCDEETARRVAALTQRQPVYPLEINRLIADNEKRQALREYWVGDDDDGEEFDE